jgi:diaminopimelate epimerase
MIPFTKMQGIGNDYVYVDCFEERLAGVDLPELARRIADRHYGVGGDGLILVMPPDEGVHAHVRMRMFNADGSESEMCGNGVRCVCKLARDRGITTANPMRVQTGAGVLELAYTLDERGLVDQVTVDMGEPVLEPARVPVDVGRLLASNPPYHAIEGARGRHEAIFVSMGNPHAVIHVADVQRIDLACEGPALERHPAFPRRMNVHFVQVHSPGEVTMRTWERGSGITLACGTGAAAVCVAGVLAGRTAREVLIHLPGGDLRLRWDEKTNHVFKTGPAVEVFTGEWRG